MINVPSEEFLRLYNANPSGNNVKIWNSMISLAVANETDNYGNAVTLSYLLDKMKLYIQSMEMQGKEKKYWKSFASFVSEKMYNFSFEATKTKASWVQKFIGGLNESQLPKSASKKLL